MRWLIQLLRSRLLRRYPCGSSAGGCLALAMLVVSPILAAAQPKVGDRLSDFMPTELGYRIPLPAGTWEVTAYGDEPLLNSIVSRFVLRSLEADSPTPYLAVRYASRKNAPSQWGDPCRESSSRFTALWSSRHGALPTQFAQRCQRVWIQRLPREGDSRDPVFWRNLYSGFGGAPEALKSELMVRSNFNVAVWYGDYVNVDAYIRPTLFNQDPAALLAERLTGKPNQWVSAYLEWTAQYVDALNSSVLDRKYKAIAPFPVQATVAVATSTPNSPVAPVSSSDTSQPVSVASTASTASAAAEENAERERRKAESERQQAEALRRQAELEERMAREEEVRRKAQDEREALARRVKEQEETERARVLAETQRQQAEARRQRAELEDRTARESAARRQAQEEREALAQRLQQEEQARLKEQQERAALEQRVKQEQLERERLLAESRERQTSVEQRLRAEEEARRMEQEARRKEQQEKEQIAQRAAQEKAERERLQAEVQKLRDDLRKARQSAAAANLVQRKALVIGIDSYRHISRLATAREDARAIADALRTAGFSVTLHLDLGEKDMRAALRKFSNEVEGGDEVAFFFAGHGVQLAGVNFLIPADVNGESEAQLREDAIPLQRIMDDMTDRKAKLTLAIVDACRDNPFRVAGRNVGNSVRGLAPTTPATGQMVIFSAGAGQRALDNLGPADSVRNGVFTRVFVQEMRQRGVPIDRVARNTRAEVVRLARSIGHEQVPAIYDQLLGEFFLLK